MEEQENQFITEKKKKRQLHRDDVIRNKKVKGEPHIMHRKDRIVVAKSIGPDCE